MLTLTWVAAVTKRVRLGTSVLVLPMRHRLPLAKELATLHNFSEGRLILGAGVGWLEAEFAALGVPFNERGRRSGRRPGDDARGVDAGSGHVQKPLYSGGDRGHDHDADAEQPDPALAGGSSEAALRRTIRIADGWHGSRHSPAEAAPIVQRLRAERPGSEFTISMRVHWNGQDFGVLRAAVDGYAEIGVEHIMIGPVDRNVDDWDNVINGVGKLLLAS